MSTKPPSKFGISKPTFGRTPRPSPEVKPTKAHRVNVIVPPPPPSSRPVWYKRKYLVYPRFQLSIILINSAVTMIMFGFVAYQVIRSHIQLENMVRSTRLPAQSLFSQMLSMQLKSLLINLGVALGFSLLLMAVSTLLFSHRLAGPMIRMKNYFSKISQSGDFPNQITFRKGDFFEELPPLINGAFESIKKKCSK